MWYKWQEFLRLESLTLVSICNLSPIFQIKFTDTGCSRLGLMTEFELMTAGVCVSVCVQYKIFWSTLIALETWRFWSVKMTVCRTMLPVPRPWLSEVLRNHWWWIHYRPFIRNHYVLESLDERDTLNYHFYHSQNDQGYAKSEKTILIIFQSIASHNFRMKLLFLQFNNNFNKILGH